MTSGISLKIGNKTVSLSNSANLLLVAGPCVVESEKLCLSVAKRCKDIASKYKLQYIFKASYKKANRTKGDSFRSIGFLRSLDILNKVKDVLNVPVLTDIHSEYEAFIVADYVDILQIPAFLSRQTDILEAAAETGKIINIKKGQFLSPVDFGYQIKKIEKAGNKKILITERGSMFGYNNLVVDFRSLSIMKKYGYPVIFDVTHSLQMPSGDNGVSGGTPEFILPMTRAAVASGINGIFIETHPNPAKALSDAGTMLPLSKLEGLIKQAVKIHKLVNTFND
jgi:2-dehydro-3-deoxyphosphooctonate aldolase (KDO 8-P synthase)